MKLILTLIATSIIALILSVSFTRIEKKKASPKHDSTQLKSSSATSFAIVELFTSQGCSSCPAADKVLSKLIDSEDYENVYGLSFHVSYWNYLGWKDPYSSEEFTQRQRNYSKAMNLGRVYTPQMIINGKNEFVGSQQSKVKNAVSKALKQNIESQLTFNISNKNKLVKVDYDFEGVSKGIVINAALVERNISNKVPRGENGGRTLHHDNVVRIFKTSSAAAKETILLRIPDDINIENSAVILYAQHDRSKAIVAAAKIDL